MERRPPGPRERPARIRDSHPHPAPTPAPKEGADFEVITGVRAGLAVLSRRREDVLEVALAREVRGEVEALTRWCRTRGLPCAELPPRELEARAGSPLHEGLVVLARPRRWTTPAELADLLVRAKGVAVALDRVRNPYNVGAVLRGAAFFGLEGALLGAMAQGPALPGVAVRVAEGGAEHLALCRTSDLGETLSRLKSHGIQVVGADGASQTSLYHFPFARPTVLVMGHEREGLTERVRARCDAVVAIPGAGTVESLNVAVAAGVLFAETARSHLTRPRPTR